MKEYKINIPEELTNYIESLQYETIARQDLLTFILRNADDLTTSNAFHYYHDEYVTFHTKYKLSQEELVATYIAPRFSSWTSWHLDFNTSILTVETEEK